MGTSAKALTATSTTGQCAESGGDRYRDIALVLRGRCGELSESGGVGEDGGAVYFETQRELGAKDNGKSVSVGGAEDSG